MLDYTDDKFRRVVLPHCRLKLGEIWIDPEGCHVVGCGDCADGDFVQKLTSSVPAATLAVHDPPYNLHTFRKRTVDEYMAFCRQWLDRTYNTLADDAALYIWMGADQKNHFQPLPQFMALMAETDFTSRSFITMRNQRGYGTQRNWMAVRQELLYYTKGTPSFEVGYTDIPKILRGYYKEVDGVMTENMARSRSDTIRPGNVWVDVQQVFYRMEENVEGCIAQKPLKAIERIISASSRIDDVVLDFFAHSGTTTMACELTGRRSITCDIDPVFAEVTIRRLEHFRATGRTGWQRGSPFDEAVSKSTPLLPSRA
jgi:site-specific DNA-methyltransferase (adenine-specific)